MSKVPLATENSKSLGQLGKRTGIARNAGLLGNFTVLRTLVTEMRQEKAAEDRYRFGLELLKSGLLSDG